jgi:phospholipid/cholesterol/gamma-HCH transport system ATP-binding protein
LHEGKKHWEGTNKEILQTDNPVLNEFIFASKFFKELKKHISGNE